MKSRGEDTSKVKDVAKRCGEEWKALSDAEKKPFTDKSAKDRERYLKEVTLMLQIILHSGH